MQIHHSIIWSFLSVSILASSSSLPDHNISRDLAVVEPGAELGEERIPLLASVVVGPGRMKGSSRNAKCRVNFDKFPDNLLVDIFYQMSMSSRVERAWRSIAKIRALNKRMNALMVAVLERLTMDHPFFANQSRLIATHRVLSHPRILHSIWTREDQIMYDWLERKSTFAHYMHHFVEQNNGRSLLLDTSVPIRYLFKREARSITHSLWGVCIWIGAVMIVILAEYLQERLFYFLFTFWLSLIFYVVKRNR